MRIALFVACYNDTLFPETGIAVTQVLERLGHTVTFPMEQTCCGQMHYNTGFHREAVPIVRRFVQTFRDAEAVCVPSSSCVSMMREHYEMIAEASNDAAFLAEVRSLLPRIHEFSELLVNRLGVEDVGATFAHRVAYHASCHSVRVLHLGDVPIRLLRAVRGLELVEIPDREQCCGFGGTFAIKYPDISEAIVRDKVGCAAATQAEVLIVNDAGCAMNIAGACHRHKAAIRVRHLAELLASAIGNKGEGGR